MSYHRAAGNAIPGRAHLGSQAFKSQGEVQGSPGVLLQSYGQKESVFQVRLLQAFYMAIPNNLKYVASIFTPGCVGPGEAA